MVVLRLASYSTLVYPGQDRRNISETVQDNGSGLFNVKIVGSFHSPYPHLIALKPAMSKKTALAKLLALVEGWFDFVEKRTLPGGCFVNAVSSEYRARQGRIRDRIVEHRVATRDRYRRLISDAKSAGELRPDLDVDQLVFDLIASEAVANVAALMEDNEEFERARSTSLGRIKESVPSSLLKAKRPQGPKRSGKRRPRDVS
jgi:hypothetical protein